jgi:hypothetical protein
MKVRSLANPSITMSRIVGRRSRVWMPLQGGTTNKDARGQIRVDDSLRNIEPRFEGARLLDDSASCTAGIRASVRGKTWPRNHRRKSRELKVRPFFTGSAPPEVRKC